MQTIDFANSEESERKILDKFNPKSIKNSEISSKIDPKIIEILQNKNPTSMANNFGTNFFNDEVFVYVYIDSDELVFPNGIEVSAQSDNIIVARMNLSQLIELGNNDNVKKITLPKKLKPLSHAHSEGVEFSFANQMHVSGWTGNGVKVAVVDVDFFSSDPEILNNVVFSKLFDSINVCGGSLACGASPGNSHGTAVAEIAVDMAPDVDLYLYTIVTSVDFNNAIDDAIAKNVDIITISLGSGYEGGDGTTGFFRDGTSLGAKKVNQAKNAGILVTVSAGNEADTHWKGIYSTSPVPPANLGLPHQSVMNFNPSALGNMRACLPVTDFGYDFIATWNDWNASNQDYDFYLFDSTMTTNFYTVLFISGIGGSDALQTGIQEPLEVFSWTGSGNACLVLASYLSTQNHIFDIYTTGNDLNPNFKVPSGSINTPADASGALSVGAVNQSTDTLEVFSSQGPTNDSRLKPEICGPDNTLSHQSEINPFFGTSASTPHVAGAAALLMQQNPSFTVEQIKNQLIDDARFNASYSVNNLCGSTSGAISLQAAAFNDAPNVTIISPTSFSEFIQGEDILFSGTATDIEDGNISSNLQWTSDLGGLIGTGPSFINATLSLGTHAITAFVTDSGGASGSKQIPITIVLTPSCTPPISGDWIISSSCILNENSFVNGNILVENNSVLEIPSGIMLNMDFDNFNLTIKSGSGVLIKSGGKISSIGNIVIFNENFDGVLDGWSQTLCQTQDTSQSCTPIFQSEFAQPLTSYHPLDPAISEPYWGIVQIFDSGGGCAGPVQAKYSKEFSTPSHGDYTIKAVLGVTDAGGAIETATLYIDGVQIFQRSGIDGQQEPTDNQKVFFESTIRELNAGTHTIDIGAHSTRTCSGQFQAAFDDIEITLVNLAN